MPIPELLPSGLLPPGVHVATWDEVQQTFGASGHRRTLLRLLKLALSELKKHGCQRVYLDGSFVTGKKVPSDYDMCWDPAGVDLAALDPVLRKFDNRRAAMKAKFGGDIFPSVMGESGSGKLFLEFFQIDKLTGDPKGIIQIDLGTLP